MIQDDEIKLPCLLDRLLDAAPGVPHEQRVQRVMSPADYKAAVLRDLGWLLNSCRQREFQPVYEFPEAARSVINYGIRDLTGLTDEGIDDVQLEREIRDAILTWEPRIIGDSLHVRMIREVQNPGRIAFEISGLLWSLPHPERLRVLTEVDLETGDCQLSA